MNEARQAILVVEDEMEIREYLSAILRGAGYDVVESDSVGTAIAALGSARFDVVLCDIGLPDGDGLSVLAHVSALDRGIHFVVCTASATFEHAVRALHSGAYDFLAKPVDRNVLLATMRRAMESRRLEEENARVTASLLASQGLLVEQSAQLEKKVWERTSDLRSSNERLAAANRELQETRDHMIRAEKMASIGTIAAGVAHEINNPIGFINSNLQTLRGYITAVKPVIEEMRRLAPPDPALQERIKRSDLDFVLSDVETLVRESEDGVKRVVKIVKDLKTFSHGGGGSAEDADLNECIASAINLSRNETKHVADVVTELANLPKIRCWPGEITQVLVNLIVNAAQAMDGKWGTITVRSRVEDAAVVLEVEDDGSGIPKNALVRIFDPFFTTKEPGRGTGLGLSLSYQIMKRHEGEILVESEVGKGTTFELRIPMQKPVTQSVAKAAG